MLANGGLQPCVRDTIPGLYLCIENSLHWQMGEDVWVHSHACRYFPCTVQWFLKRSELQLIRKGWRRRVLRVIERVGELDGESLKRAESWFGTQPFKRSFMMLRLVDPQHRSGQRDRLNQALPHNKFPHACCIHFFPTMWALQRP